MTIIADAGALYALYDRDDRHHRAVADCIAATGEAIVVPSAILGELDHLLRRHLGPDAALAFLSGLSDGAFVLIDLDSADLARCQDLIAGHQGLDLGLVDAAIIATAERLGTDRVLTVDLRRFRDVRACFGPLTLLPADR